jgi:hypothetical protein
VKKLIILSVFAVIVVLISAAIEHRLESTLDYNIPFKAIIENYNNENIEKFIYDNFNQCIFFCTSSIKNYFFLTKIHSLHSETTGFVQPTKMVLRM